MDGRVRGGLGVGVVLLLVMMQSHSQGGDTRKLEWSIPAIILGFNLIFIFRVKVTWHQASP